ncbi:hypothetical protein D3C71_2220830 [compost metagenome]
MQPPRNRVANRLNPAARPIIVLEVTPRLTNSVGAWIGMMNVKTMPPRIIR